MSLKSKIICFLFVLLTSHISTSCAQSENKQNTITVTATEEVFDKFTRDKIKLKFKNKIEDSIPLVIHVFVPLCDNLYQGIIPVGGKLGDGRNLKTNLYWGAGYGLKTWFIRSIEWKLLNNELFQDSSILERAVYSRTYKNKANVYLILDAWAGDKMQECLINYFNSLAGILKDSASIGSSKIPAFSNSDFLIFNGHNGLMDSQIEVIKNRDGVEKDAAVIACISHNYFTERFRYLKAYPLVLTTSLLPPEAYVVSAIIDNWALQNEEELIRTSAGEAMARIHKIAVKPCVNMFKTGW